MNEKSKKDVVKGALETMGNSPHEKDSELFYSHSGLKPEQVKLVDEARVAFMADATEAVGEIGIARGEQDYRATLGLGGSTTADFLYEKQHQPEDEDDDPIFNYVITAVDYHLGGENCPIEAAQRRLSALVEASADAQEPEED